MKHEDLKEMKFDISYCKIMYVSISHLHTSLHHILPQYALGHAPIDQVLPFVCGMFQLFCIILYLVSFSIII